MRKGRCPDIFRVLEGRAKARYLLAKKSGLLDKKIKQAFQILKSCELCERKCRVDRTKGKLGVCKTGAEFLISSMGRHFGEEKLLVPSYTIFLGNLCTFRCVFCQNYDIAHLPHYTKKFEPKALAEILDTERREGVLNWNWVGSEPTPLLPFVLKTLSYCKENCPSIWNSNMCMTEKSMGLLEGTQDVYLADLNLFTASPGHPGSGLAS